jgi:hypothetical protein
MFSVIVVSVCILVLFIAAILHTVDRTAEKQLTILLDQSLQQQIVNGSVTYDQATVHCTTGTVRIVGISMGNTADPDHSIYMTAHWLSVTVSPVELAKLIMNPQTAALTSLATTIDEIHLQDTTTASAVFSADTINLNLKGNFSADTLTAADVLASLTAAAENMQVTAENIQLVPETAVTLLLPEIARLENVFHLLQADKRDQDIWNISQLTANIHQENGSVSIPDFRLESPSVIVAGSAISLPSSSVATGIFSTTLSVEKLDPDQAGTGIGAALSALAAVSGTAVPENTPFTISFSVQDGGVPRIEVGN